MLPLQKNKKIRQINSVDFLIPAAGIILPEKLDEIKNSMVFHLDIVKKIDKIIRDHEKKTILDELVSTKKPICYPVESLVELRSPLNKKIDGSFFNIDKKQDSSFYKKLTIPDEFKTDFNGIHNTSFRFESELYSSEDVLYLKNPENKHVEVIDINSLALNSGAFQKNRIETILPDNLYGDKFGNNSLKNDRVDVIETKKFVEKSGSDNDKQEKRDDKGRACVYYINSNEDDDKTQSYIPVDFEEKFKKLKEKEKKILEKQKIEQEKIEEKQKVEQKKIEEKQRLEQEKEDKRLKKLEEKKAKLEERQRLKEEKKTLAEKQKQEAEEKKLLKKEAKNIPNKEIRTNLSKKDLKRLHKIEMKKAKLEAKHKKKKEKEKLVETLVQEAEEKKQSKKKIKNKDKKGLDADDIATYEPIDEQNVVDEDLVKVLLMTDELLGSLPEDVIEKFTQSEDFELYQKVINKYKPK